MPWPLSTVINSPVSKPAAPTPHPPQSSWHIFEKVQQRTVFSAQGIWFSILNAQAVIFSEWCCVQNAPAHMCACSWLRMDSCAAVHLLSPFNPPAHSHALPFESVLDLRGEGGWNEPILQFLTLRDGGQFDQVDGEFRCPHCLAARILRLSTWDRGDVYSAKQQESKIGKFAAQTKNLGTEKLKFSLVF